MVAPRCFSACTSSMKRRCIRQVKTACGLIDQEHARAVCKRANDTHLLPVALRHALHTHVHVKAEKHASSRMRRHLGSPSLRTRADEHRCSPRTCPAKRRACARSPLREVTRAQHRQRKGKPLQDENDFEKNRLLRVENDQTHTPSDLNRIKHRRKAGPTLLRPGVLRRCSNVSHVAACEFGHFRRETAAKLSSTNANVHMSIWAFARSDIWLLACLDIWDTPPFGRFEVPRIAMPARRASPYRVTSFAEPLTSAKGWSSQTSIRLPLRRARSPSSCQHHVGPLAQGPQRKPPISCHPRNGRQFDAPTLRHGLPQLTLEACRALSGIAYTRTLRSVLDGEP